MSKKALIILFLVILVFYLPIFIKPDLFLNKGNDLSEFFWPIYAYAKDAILKNWEFPLWNNLFLSGTPLLPDPQSPLFYPLNIIFLLLPMGTAFIFSTIAHTLLGGMGMYLLARKVKISFLPATFAGVLYIIAPRLAGFIDAGHFGLITAGAWIPYAFYSILDIADRPSFKHSFVFALSLSALFLTHTSTLILVFPLAVAFFAYLIVFTYVKNRIIKISRLAASIFMFLGLSSIVLLPQLTWIGETTRFLQLSTRETYPIWSSFAEFIKSVFIPWLGGIDGIEGIDTEKWIALGIAPFILSLVGFTRLKKIFKLSILALAIGSALFATNNASPFYTILSSLDFYQLLRVTTRIWFAPVIVVSLLAAYGFMKLQERSISRRIVYLLAVFSILELLFLSWAKILTPKKEAIGLAPIAVFDFLTSDKDGPFRVFCTTRCLSQKEAQEYGLELIEGYSTLTQMNYFRETWQLMGGYWNYYTLAIPPIGFYKFEKLKPDAISLGEFNTKYVVSPYEINDKNLVVEKGVEGFIVYLNKAYQPRAYFQKEDQTPGRPAPIVRYTPNHVRVDVSSQEERRIVLSQVYSEGWKAYINGATEVPVQEKPNALMLVDLTADTKFVDFKYEPDSYYLGRLVTFSTLILIAIITVRKYSTT